jgi:hypothetical protein
MHSKEQRNLKSVPTITSSSSLPQNSKFPSKTCSFLGYFKIQIFFSLVVLSPQKPSPLEPHPHRTSPTQNAAENQPDIQLCFSHLCTTWTLWPEVGQARPKHVVAIAAINTIPRQLCFWRTLLPSFNTRKHNGDVEPEDSKWLMCFYTDFVFCLTCLNNEGHILIRTVII